MNLLGLLAASLTTGAWLPQILRTWQSRSAHDLSWGYLATTFIGLTCWLAYGLGRRDAAIVLANAVSLTLLASLCVFKAASDRSTRTARRAVDTPAGALSRSA